MNAQAHAFLLAALIGGITACPVPDPCQDLGCGPRGLGCASFDGQTRCLCELGYEGLRCEICADGYLRVAEVCVLPCAATGLDCGANGVCANSGDDAACVCDPGYAGESCAVCDTGYQDEDGDKRCQPDCNKAALSCADHASCSTATGTAVCECDAGYAGEDCNICASGYQDNDGDTVCTPGYALAALTCVTHARCYDSDGTPDCACVPGYADNADACDWVGVIQDPGFQRTDVWQVSGGAEIRTTAAGNADLGEGYLSGASMCTGGSIYQVVTIPAIEYSERLLLQFVTDDRSDCTDAPACGSIRTAFALNGRWNEIVRTGIWSETVRCLGEVSYGVDIQIEFGTLAGTPATCPNSQLRSLAVDGVMIVPDRVGVCPPPGVVLNGNFESGELGWSSPEGITAKPGIGESGTAGLEVTLSGACSARVTGTASIPASTIEAGPSLSIWASGGPDVAVSLRFDGVPVGRLHLGEPSASAKFCLSSWVAGHAGLLEVFISNTSGTCSTPIVIDSISVDNDPSCQSDAFIADGGFERSTIGTSRASIWSGGSTGAASANIIEDSALALTGQKVLRLGVTNTCDVASAGAGIVVPESLGTGEGPAVQFAARSPGLVDAVARVWIILGGLQEQEWVEFQPASDWKTHTVCLNPTWANRSPTMIFLFDAPKGTCGNTAAKQVLWIDDVEIVTSPLCPQSP